MRNREAGYVSQAQRSAQHTTTEQPSNPTGEGWGGASEKSTEPQSAQRKQDQAIPSAWKKEKQLRARKKEKLCISG